MTKITGPGKPEGADYDPKREKSPAQRVEEIKELIDTYKHAGIQDASEKTIQLKKQLADLEKQSEEDPNNQQVRAAITYVKNQLLE